MRLGILNQCEWRVIKKCQNLTFNQWNFSDLFFHLKDINLGAHFFVKDVFKITLIFETLFFKWCPIFDKSPSQNTIISSKYIAFWPKSFFKTRQSILPYFILVSYTSKGYLISKCIFGIFNSPTKTIRLEVRSRVEVFRSFFGRIEDTKKTFRN